MSILQKPGKDKDVTEEVYKTHEAIKWVWTPYTLKSIAFPLWMTMDQRKRKDEEKILASLLVTACSFVSHRNFLNTQASSFLDWVDFYGFGTCKNNERNPCFVLLRHVPEEKVFATEGSRGAECCFCKKWVLFQEVLRKQFWKLSTKQVMGFCENESRTRILKNAMKQANIPPWIYDPNVAYMSVDQL